jgi:hypothetical protein
VGVWVGVYLHMHVICVFVYACLLVCAYVCTCVCAYVCMCVCMCVCLHVCVFARVYIVCWHAYVRSMFGCVYWVHTECI